jgi:hypothetical protein
MLSGSSHDHTRMYAFLSGFGRDSLDYRSPLPRCDDYRPFPQIRPSLSFQGNAEVTDV